MTKILRNISILAAVAALFLMVVAGSAFGGENVKAQLKSFSITLDKKSVKKGTVTFTASNNSGTAHTLCIEGNGVDKCTPTFSKGDKTLKVDLKKAGSYEAYCSVDDHKGKGMEAKIKVT